MKKKVIILTSALLILGLAIVAYSVTKSTTTLNTPDSCCAMKDCCKDGVCKMGGDCCKDKDNCPMKSKDSKEMSSMNHDDKAECCKDGKCSMNSDCCKDGVCKMGCCKDGKCDMQAHKKDGEATAMKGDCCKGKDSCPMHKGENKDKKDN